MFAANLLLLAIACVLPSQPCDGTPVTAGPPAPESVATQLAEQALGQAILNRELVAEYSLDGAWSVRPDNRNYLVMRPAGPGDHAITVYWTTPNLAPLLVDVPAGGEIVIFKTSILVDVAGQNQWKALRNSSRETPSSAPCDGVYNNVSRTTFDLPTGDHCWGNLMFDVGTGGWSRECSLNNSKPCKGKITFDNGTNKEITFGCGAAGGSSTGLLQGNGGTVAVTNSTNCS